MNINNLIYEKYLNEFKYKYYMVKSIKKFKDYNDEIEVFGIKIDKLFKDGTLIETREIDKVGINKQDVALFLKTLCDNKKEPKDLTNINDKTEKAV